MYPEIQPCPWPVRPVWLTLSQPQRCHWCGHPTTEVAIAEVNERLAVLICQGCSHGCGHDC